MYTWGNSYEFLGTGNSISQYTPYKISQITRWKQMFVNRNTFAIFAIDKDNLLYSWGCNSDGQIGNGTSNTQLTPYLVSFTKWKYFHFSAFDEITLISDANNLTLSNNLTYLNKKVLVEGDIKLPITIDENGDYVLG